MASVRFEERPDSLNERGSARKEILPILLMLTGGLVCYGLFVNRGLGLHVIGYSVAPAERVMQGEIPYRDFLFNYTPGILWVNALLMRAFGATIMATRIGLFAFKLATLVTLYHLGRRLTNKWLALVPVALTLAWLGHRQIFSVYPDQYLMLFALGALLCMLKYDETSGGRWLVLCGLAIGTVFLFKYNVGMLLLASGLLVISTRAMMTTRRIADVVEASAIYLSGFAIVLGALVAYLVYNNAMGAMAGHFLHHAAEYSESRAVGLPSATFLFWSAVILLPPLAVGVVILFGAGRAFAFYWVPMVIVESWFVLHASAGKVFGESVIAWVAYFPPLVFTCALILAGWQLKHRRRNENWWRDNGAIAITGLFALAVYLEVFPRADYYHLVRVLPPVFLFFVVLSMRCLPRFIELLRTRVPLPTRNGFLLIATPVVFLLVAGVKDTWQPQFESAFHLKDNRELAIDRGRGILVDEQQAELAEGLVHLIQDNSSPDEYIFSFAQRGAGLYFMAERKNPTRILWWSAVGISSEERESVREMIRNRRAKLIIVQDVDANKEIQDFISSNYEPLGTVGDVAVYGLRPLGAQASLPASSHQNPMQAGMPALPGRSQERQ